VELPLVYHCCRSADADVDAGEGVGDDADDFHNA